MEAMPERATSTTSARMRPAARAAEDSGETSASSRPWPRTRRTRGTDSSTASPSASRAGAAAVLVAAKTPDMGF